MRRTRFYLLLAAGAGIVSAVFHGFGLTSLLPWHIVYSDMLGFFERVAAPGFPYIDKLMEYPVLTGLFIHVMGALGVTRSGYYFLSAVFLILFGIAATYFLIKLVKGSDRSDNEKFLTYWIFAPSMLMFSVFNWDMIAVLFSLLAFYFIQKNKNSFGAVFLALGASAKFYPVLFLVPLLLKQKNLKEWAKIAGAFIATFVIANGYFMFSNFEGWSYFFTLNRIRDSNPDSVWTLARFFLGDFSVNATNVISLLMFGISFVWAMRRFRKASYIALCFIATILFLFFNKIFSPQYLLWLLPFFALLSLNGKKWFYALEFSNLAAFFIILPWFFTKDMSYFYWSAPFVLFRHIVLFLILLKAFALARFSSSGNFSKS